MCLPQMHEIRLNEDLIASFENLRKEKQKTSHKWASGSDAVLSVCCENIIM